MLAEAVGAVVRTVLPIQAGTLSSGLRALAGNHAAATVGGFFNPSVFGASCLTRVQRFSTLHRRSSIRLSCGVFALSCLCRVVYQRQGFRRIIRLDSVWNLLG